MSRIWKILPQVEIAGTTEKNAEDFHLSSA